MEPKLILLTGFWKCESSKLNLFLAILSSEDNFITAFGFKGLKIPELNADVEFRRY